MTMACAGDSIMWLNSEGQLVHWAGINAEGNRKERREQLAKERRKQ